MNETATENASTLTVLRDPPESFSCVYKDEWPAIVAPITYDSIFYERSNQPTGGLDIRSGVFTAPYPGTYTVSWTLRCSNIKGQYAELQLYKNDDRVYETQHYSSLDSASHGNDLNDQGGVTLIMHLDMGEELSLHYTDGDAPAIHVMFCVQLSQFDQIEGE